jgi:cold shock protein
MQVGTVKFFNEAKGFGFITTETGEDLFVHVSGLLDKVQQGAKVTFDIEKGTKGLYAIRVQVIR